MVGIRFKQFEGLKFSECFYITSLNELDFELYFELYSNDELMKFIRRPMCFDLAQKSFLKTLEAMKKPSPSIYLFVIYNQAHEHVGILGFKKQEAKTEFEIGVVIKEKYQKRGVSQSIKVIVLNQIFSKSSTVSISAFCHPENLIPNYINKKLGFDFVGEGNYYGYKMVMNKWIMDFNKYSEMYIDFS